MDNISCFESNVCFSISVMIIKQSNLDALLQWCYTINPYLALFTGKKKLEDV